MPLEEKEFLIGPTTIGQSRIIGDVRWGPLEEEPWPDGQVVLFRQAFRRDRDSDVDNPYTLVVGFKASGQYAKSERGFQQRAIQVRLPNANQERELTAHFREKFENHPVVFFK